ncbi:MAG: hypothetical protein NTU47_09560 [Ignavibacteriales bacterium]|nr:hypothetical protein [Ignavibacteriales bacterium]
MSADDTTTMSQKGRDLALIFTLTNSAVNQALVQEMYMKTFGLSPEQTEAHVADLRKQIFADVCTTLAKYGDLDVSSLLQLLETSGDEKGTTKSKSE